MKTGISIVTNWGCRAGCWYCIWKQHPLKDVCLPMDWEKLERFLASHKEVGKLSVSGGGDCLYRIAELGDWWDRVRALCQKYNLKLDVHTRERLYDYGFWRQINQAVISSDHLADDKEYLDYLSGNCGLRVTHVVTKKTSIDLIEQYVKYAKDNGVKFTVKKIVGYDDGGMYDLVKAKFPDLFYLDPGDYNLYYMPNNEVWKVFLDEKSVIPC